MYTDESHIIRRILDGETALYIYCGESLSAAFGSLLTAFTGPAFSPCLQLGVLILLLLGLDHGMRRMYQSHKKKASRHGNN